MVTRLKVEKAQVEASLREEEAKCGLLLKEVKDSNEARQSLEKLLSNVKGDSIELENKLQVCWIDHCLSLGIMEHVGNGSEVLVFRELKPN